MVYSHWDTPTHPHSHVDPRWLHKSNTVPPADIFQNVVTGLPTSTKSYQAPPLPHSHHGQSTTDQISPTPYTSSSESLRTSFAGHLPRNLQHLDVECIDPDLCGACRSRCFGTGSMATTPPEMPRCSQCNWLCLSFIFVVLVTTWSGRGRVSPFLRAWPQKVRARTPSGRQTNAFGQFALKKRTWTIPWVNPHPKVLRWGLEDLSCQLGLFSWFHSVLPVDGLQDECLDGLPVGFADDAPNLLTLVGTIIWIVERHFCDDASDWHRICSEMVYTLLWLKEILPMPDLAGTHFGWSTCHDVPVILATALTMTTTTATTIFDDPCGYSHVRQELESRSKNRWPSRVSFNLLDGGHTIGV
ncbi:hypothetical protein BDN67DRAFT_512033 [Paxillus ammoniavirescens]|nr:hypothetical protein BDN67DRAFT_512033 [Paxillus ammoniavirescens]